MYSFVQLCAKGEVIHETTQEHRIHKIENLCTKQENLHKKSVCYIIHLKNIIWELLQKKTKVFVFV